MKPGTALGYIQACLAAMTWWVGALALAGGLPVALAQSPALPPGAPVSMTYQPLNEQLEVFFFDTGGMLKLVWKDNNHAWQGPIGLTNEGQSVPKTHVASVYYPNFRQLEVFFIDGNGVLNVVSKANNGQWNAAVGITDRGLAPPGAPLSVTYQPLNEQLEVFVVGSDGALNVVWKDNNSVWKGPIKLTAPGTALAGAHVASVYYPNFKQLEVLHLDRHGALNLVWKTDNGVWNNVITLTAAGFAPPGAPVLAVYQELNEQLEVLTVDSRGSISVVWKDNNNPWKGPVGLTPSDTAELGSTLAGIYYAPNNQIDVLFNDKRGAMNILWKDNNSVWKGPIGITEPQFVPGAPIAAAHYKGFDHVEAVSSDRDGILKLEWKVRNKAWIPCPVGLTGTAAPRPLPQVVLTPTVLRTERFGQLTGSPDPDTLPVLNAPNTGEWLGSGVVGTDLGANTDHNGKLFIFFGDTVPGNGSASPARDTDFAGWTSETSLRPGGFALHPVKSGRFFDPITIDGGVGTLPIGRTPTGAFSYGGKAYMFALWDDPNDPFIPGTTVKFPTTVLASKVDPERPGPFHLELTLSKRRFWQVAAVVVKNADHPGLPSSQGDGLVLLGGGLGEGDGIYLAWMRLDPAQGPIASSIRYYTRNPAQPWTKAENNEAAALARESEARAVVVLPPHYTSVSADWLPELKQWIVIYSRATDDKKVYNPAGPVVARFGSSPWTWSDEVQIFNTCRDGGHGRFMHWISADDINKRIPPSEEIWGDNSGWAYGAFLMRRFSRWDGRSRELSLAYLMSTSNPYQVQVMETKLRMPVVLARPLANPIRKLRAVGIDFSVPQPKLRQWLQNSEFTPYPAMAEALLMLMNGRVLKRDVYIDVIVWKYEHELGGTSPRRAADVDLLRLQSAILASYNERYGTSVASFPEIVK